MAALANEYNIYTLSLFNWWAQSCLILKTRNSFLAYVLQLKVPTESPEDAGSTGLTAPPWSGVLLLWLLAATVKSSKKAKLFSLK